MNYLVQMTKIRSQITTTKYNIICKCVVPENIHTPTTEGIGNSGGMGGGSKAQEIPERRGNVSEITFPDGQVRCCDDLVRGIAQF